MDEHHGLLEQFSQVKHELELSVMAQEREETGIECSTVCMSLKMYLTLQKYVVRDCFTKSLSLSLFPSPPPSPPNFLDFIGEELHVDIHNMSQDELTTLQNNFNALQQRFVALMAEKADLLDQFQEQEHTVTQLASETETIGMV